MKSITNLIKVYIQVSNKNRTGFVKKLLICVKTQITRFLSKTLLYSFNDFVSKITREFFVIFNQTHLVTNIFSALFFIGKIEGNYFEIQREIFIDQVKPRFSTKIFPVRHIFDAITGVKMKVSNATSFNTTLLLISSTRNTTSLSHRSCITINKRYYPGGLPGSSGAGKTPKIPSSSSSSETSVPNTPYKKQDLEQAAETCIKPSFTNSSTPYPLPPYTVKEQEVKPSVDPNKPYYDSCKDLKGVVDHKQVEKPDVSQQPSIVTDYKFPDNPSEVLERITTVAKEDNILNSSIQKGSSSDLTEPVKESIAEPLSSKEVTQKAEENYIIDFAEIGKYNDNGSPRLSRYGHNLDRINDRTKTPIKKTETELKLEAKSEIVSDNKYFMITTIANDNDTVVLKPEQGHMVVAKGDPNGTQPVEGILYCTSQEGTKVGLNGLAGPQNPMLSPTQPISGNPNPQFAVPLIPPLTFKSDEYEIHEKGTEYLQDPKVIAKVDSINMEVSQYKAIPYQAEGITVAKLQELNDLHDILHDKNDNEDVD